MIALFSSSEGHKVHLVTKYWQCRNTYSMCLYYSLSLDVCTIPISVPIIIHLHLYGPSKWPPCDNRSGMLLFVCACLLDLAVSGPHFFFVFRLLAWYLTNKLLQSDLKFCHLQLVKSFHITSQIMSEWLVWVDFSVCADLCKVLLNLSG